jgi:hypothetical protein
MSTTFAWWWNFATAFGLVVMVMKADRVHGKFTGIQARELNKCDKLRRHLIL